MVTKLKVLLLEPFNSGSHQAWAEGLIKHTRHEISLISHPGSFWRWRVRGSALTIAEETQEIVNEKGKPDIVLASGMIDLPAWLGFTKRFIGDPPVVLYQHENQLTYPVSSSQPPGSSMKFVNWKNMGTKGQNDDLPALVCFIVVSVVFFFVLLFMLCLTCFDWFDVFVVSY